MIVFHKQVKDDDVTLAIRAHKVANPLSVLEGFNVPYESNLSNSVLAAYYISQAFYEHGDDKKRRDDKYSLRHKYEGAVRADRRRKNFSLPPQSKILYTAHDWGEDIVKSIVGGVVMEHFVKNRFHELKNIQQQHHLVTNHYSSVWKGILAEINGKKEEAMPFDLINQGEIIDIIENKARNLEDEVNIGNIEESFDIIEYRLTWFKDLFIKLWENEEYQTRPNLKLDLLDSDWYTYVKDILEESIDILMQTKAEKSDILDISLCTGREIYEQFADLISNGEYIEIPRALLSENESILEARIKKTTYENLYVGRMVQSAKVNLSLGWIEEEAAASLSVKLCDGIDNISQLPNSIEKLYTTVRKARSVRRQALALVNWMDSNGYQSHLVQNAATYLHQRLGKVIKKHLKSYEKLAEIDTLYREDKEAFRRLDRHLKP